MRLRAGTYECAQCGAPLDIPIESRPRMQIEIHQASGDAGPLRVLTLDGKEVHRCQLPPRHIRD